MWQKADDLILRYRYPILLLLTGFLILGLGISLFRTPIFGGEDKVEIISEVKDSEGGEVVVQVAGAVQKPGVYKLESNKRIEDLLIEAGGLSEEADRGWIDKNLNLAAKLSDGQKIYLPKQSEVLSASKTGGDQTTSTSFSSSASDLVNVNVASQKTLEDLPGIGPVYAQNIIEHRPYSVSEELLSRSVLKKNVYEKIKDLINAF